MDENISNMYPLEYEMASEISDIVKEKSGLNVRAVDISYIAVHLVAIYKIWGKKLNTIIVCDYDESVINPGR